MKVDFEKRL